MTAGNENVVREIDGHRFGVDICKDMHFAFLGRRYGKEQIAAMLEPAWNFRRDAWMAARIAALRGVQNGYAVVHSARESILTERSLGAFIGEMPTRERRAHPSSCKLRSVPPHRRLYRSAIG